MSRLCQSVFGLNIKARLKEGVARHEVSVAQFREMQLGGKQGSASMGAERGEDIFESHPVWRERNHIERRQYGLSQCYFGVQLSWG